MAANEHKNLTDINRHNPKGFENATNDTILTKGSGTSPTGTDGNLLWINKSIIKTTTHEMIGYSVGNGSTYEYRQGVADAQSPFEMNADFGSATIGSQTINSINLFRTPTYVAQNDCTLRKITGWFTSSTSSNMSLAICKVTPVNNSTSAFTPVALDIITASTAGGNSLVQQFDELTFEVSSITKGDLIFPMILTTDASQQVYFTLTLEFGYDN